LRKGKKGKGGEERIISDPTSAVPHEERTKVLITPSGASSERKGEKPVLFLYALFEHKRRGNAERILTAAPGPAEKKDHLHTTICRPRLKRRGNTHLSRSGRKKEGILHFLSFLSGRLGKGTRVPPSADLEIKGKRAGPRSPARMRTSAEKESEREIVSPSCRRENRWEKEEGDRASLS